MFSVKKIVILDGHAMLFRAFYALPLLTGPAGQPLNALSGMGSMLLTILAVEKPSHLAIAFDTKGPTFRHSMDENYKANRSAPPEELLPQIEAAPTFASALSVPALFAPEFEADDFIGSLAKKVEEKTDADIVMVSSDRDLLQLVTSRVVMQDLTRGYRDSVCYTPEKVQETFGVPPSLVPAFKALSGDSSDNISGLPGIGPAIAKKLLASQPNFEELLTNPPTTFPARTIDTVKNNASAARHFLTLATIRTDAPVPELDACQLPPDALVRLANLFDSWHLPALARRARVMAGPAKKPTEPPAEQLKLL